MAAGLAGPGLVAPRVAHLPRETLLATLGHHQALEFVLNRPPRSNQQFEEMSLSGWYHHAEGLRRQLASKREDSAPRVEASITPNRAE